MQDPSTAFQPRKAPSLFPEQEQLKCPRCDSNNTKFCYYNNYNLSQPRHFCKNCRRYWTKGGALRNIPVGGGTRKNTNKRSSSSKRSNPDPKPEPARNKPTASASSSSPSTVDSRLASDGNLGLGSGQDPTRMFALGLDQDRKMLDIGGSFSSLLTSNGQFGNIFEGLNVNGSGLKTVQLGGFGENFNPGLDSGATRDPGFDGRGSGSGNSNNGSGDSGGGSDGYLQSGEWGNSNGWPNLAIYTPGSGFQ